VSVEASGSFAWIVVTANEHPELDDWVRERALEEAARVGVTIVRYLGREDVLPWPHPPDVCCHVFDARD
jgi:hypothetical protein